MACGPEFQRSEAVNLAGDVIVRRKLSESDGLTLQSHSGAGNGALQQVTSRVKNAIADRSAME